MSLPLPRISHPAQTRLALVFLGLESGKEWREKDRSGFVVCLLVCFHFLISWYHHEMTSHSKSLADVGKCNRRFCRLSSSRPAGPVAAPPVTQAWSPAPSAAASSDSHQALGLLVI